MSSVDLGDAPLLVVDDLVAGYLPEVDILRGVDIRVDRGEVVTLVGPNGAGKSTLLKAIFGLVRVKAGRVLLRGRDVVGNRPHVITGEGVGYVPQVDNIFESLTVEENLELGAIGAGCADADTRIDRMYELFPRLAERRRQRAGTMSGGERQMVAMARALVPEPELLLLDEPSAGLAPELVDAIFRTVTEINSSGVTILIVEQNARRALAMSDRGYVLDLGKTRFQGPGSELLHDPKVGALYLGGGRPSSRPEKAETDVAAAQATDAANDG